VVEIPPFNNTLHLHEPFNLRLRFRLGNKMLHQYFRQSKVWKFTKNIEEEEEAIDSRKKGKSICKTRLLMKS